MMRPDEATAPQVASLLTKHAGTLGVAPWGPRDLEPKLHETATQFQCELAEINEATFGVLPARGTYFPWDFPHKPHVCALP